MSFDVIATEPFERKLKQLAKKYISLPKDLLPLIEELAENPTTEDPLGKDCYKIRVKISSKGKGKRSGARVITFIRVSHQRVFLIDIYDKSEQINISDKELKLLIDILRADIESYPLLADPAEAIICAISLEKAKTLREPPHLPMDGG